MRKDCRAVRVEVVSPPEDHDVCDDARAAARWLIALEQESDHFRIVERGSVSERPDDVVPSRYVHGSPLASELVDVVPTGVVRLQR